MYVSQLNSKISDVFVNSFFFFPVRNTSRAMKNFNNQQEKGKKDKARQ